MLEQKGKETISCSELGNPAYPNLHLEFGFHYYEKLPFMMEGNAYQWNEETARRMKEYNPLIIIVDRLVPRGLSPQEIEIIKAGRPGPFRSITDQPEIYLVRGDLPSYGEMLLPVFQLHSLFSEIQKKKRVEIMQSIDYLCRNHIGLSDMIRVNGLFSPLILSVLVGISSQKIAKTEPISRRKFLEGAVKAVGGSVAISEAATFLQRSATLLSASFALNDETNRLAQEIASFFGPWSEKDWLCDGRTAVLTAKAFNSFLLGGFPNTAPAAMLLGGGHLPRGPEILANDALRDKVVADFAERLINSCDRIFQRYELARKLRDLARHLILYNIALTDIVKVSYYGTGTTTDPSKEEKYSIWKQFLSPSINKALLGLRGNDGFRF